MTARPPLVEIGVVGKAHGLKGEVSIVLSTNVADRLEKGATFATDAGSLVIEAIRPHQGRELVRFAGVADRSAAEALRGIKLLAEPLDEDPQGGFWVHELVDAVVVEVDGTERGIVTAVESNPASDLLVLESGALVPIDFVISVNDGRVVIDPPDGLFDLST